MCYYLLHALLVVVVGFPVGAWLGRYVSALIVSTIAIGCDLPPYTVVHDFAAWGRALGLTALCCIGSAWAGGPLAAEGDPGPVYAAQAAQEHEARGAGAARPGLASAGL